MLLQAVPTVPTVPTVSTATTVTSVPTVLTCAAVIPSLPGQYTPWYQQSLKFLDFNLECGINLIYLVERAALP